MNQVAVRNWGNSLGIRLPKAILEKLNIGSDDILDIEVKNDAIVLRRPVQHRTFEERLAEYNGQITVSEFDWGEPKGRELL